METKSTRSKHSWRPRVGWGVPVAWLTLCVVWSSTWLVIKIGLRDLPPISYAATRFVLAVIVLVAISTGRVRLLPRQALDYAVLAFTGVLMFAVNYGLLFWGELHVSSGLAAVLQATIPIFGMVFAHLMLPDEPLRLIQLAPAMIAAWQMIFGVVPLLVTGFIVEGNPLRFHWSGLSIFCLLYLAVIGSALTFLLLYWLLPRMTVANLQAISLITPPGAVALGWAIGGEKFSLWSLVGACFVLAGVWMIFRKAEVRKHALQEGEAGVQFPEG